MNCREVELLLGAYLDSELDARASQKVRQHLDQCPKCCQQYQQEQQSDAVLRKLLAPSAKDASFWEKEHRFILSGWQHPSTAQAPSRPVASASWFEIIRGLLWPSPKYYVALASIWIFLIILPWRLVESGGPHFVKAAPVSPEIQSLLTRQRQQFMELLSTMEPENQAEIQAGRPPLSKRSRSPRPIGQVATSDPYPLTDPYSQKHCLNPATTCHT